MGFTDQLLTYRHERAIRVPWFILLCALLLVGLVWWMFQLPSSGRPNTDPNRDLFRNPPHTFGAD